MLNYQIVLSVIGIIVGVVGFVGFGVSFLTKKGINVPNILSKVETDLEEAGTVISAGQELVPSKVLTILGIVDNLAIRATKSAQQLAITSQLPLDQRKVQAKANILSGLKAFDIPVSEELTTVIDDAIQQFVFDSKTPEEQRSQQETVSQQQATSLQTTVTQLTSDKVALQQQLADLNVKLSAIQVAAAQVAQATS